MERRNEIKKDNAIQHNDIDKTLIKYIEKHRNAHVLLDKDKRVAYANMVARKVFSENVNELFGNFAKCINVEREGVDCQQTSKCRACVINDILNKILNDRERRVIENIDFAFNNDIFNISFEVSYIDEYIIIEFFRVNKYEEESYLLNRICNKTSDFLYYKDMELKYKYVNDSYAKLLGLEKADIIGNKDEGLMCTEAVKNNSKTDLITIREGNYVGIEVHNDKCYRVIKEVVDGGIIGLIQDITKEVKLDNLANIDELTRLPNRRKFNKDIETIYEEKKDNCYCILIDIDDFSDINNKYGHDVGDSYLMNLSDILNAHKELTFYRIGGDEFIGIMKSKTLDKVMRITRDILDELKRQKNISVSAGVKKLDLNIEYKKNYNLLDETLYFAKRNGKNQVRSFEELR